MYGGNVMLNLSELSNEELTEYANSLDIKKPDDVSHIISCIDSLLNSFRALETKLKNVRDHVKARKMKEAAGSYDSFIYSLDRFVKKSRETAYLIPDKDALERISMDRAMQKEVHIERYENYMRIRLNELLPHRATWDPSSNGMKLYYDRTSWRASYYVAFNKAFEYGRYKLFSDKMSICYIMHVCKDEKFGFLDCDNVDTKTITDVIATFVLRDDSYGYCNLFVDIVEDRECLTYEDCYTDIIVCPAKKREWILRELGY